VANTQTGTVNFGVSGMYGRSGGWFTVTPAQRGAADTPVSIEVSNLSAHATAEVLDGTLLAVRLGAYDERRAPGIVGTEQDAKGVTGSATIARPETIGSLGWRAQIWFRNSDYASSSASLSSDRNSATPFLDAYATPALGWGANAAVRGTMPWLDWEIGADSRFNQGEARELESWVDGAFQADRFSGGRALIGGIYGEGASHIDDLLITGGLRIDEWRNSDGHTIEHTLATGDTVLNDEFPTRRGAIPTARAGIRKDFLDGWFARAAAYEGFRPPSLSELYRPTPFAVQITDANPALEPERLYGADAGIGGVAGPLSWDVNGFWNRLSGAISGVTLGVGPGVFPDVGFLPPGGRYIQLENVGFIQGIGAEGEAQWRFGDLLSLRGAFNVTDARVNGGASKPTLTGKRPAQTPRMSISAGFVAFPLPDLSVESDIAYISKRFVDDQNTEILGGAAVFNATITWHVTRETAFYLAGQNIGNTRVAFSEEANNIHDYTQPFAIRAGVTITISP
jgi:vitamin B12 transporter